jgi:cell division inhibitor SepF
LAEHVLTPEEVRALEEVLTLEEGWRFMAGAMRKMGVYLGLVGDEVVEDDYEVYEDVRRDVRGRESRGGERRVSDDRAEDRLDDRYESRGVRTLSETRAVRTFRTDAISERRPTAAPLTDWRPVPSTEITRIETVHPRSYNDARRIGEDYREGVPVIMNLSELDDSDAKRIVDFAAGLVFGLRGSIERVTNKVFLLSPPNVDVGDEARAQIAQDPFFNQS